jgi:uncharacterized flavoprotein (TIGR03862 family)
MAASAAIRVAVIGGGPAGLMAAETARAKGALVDVYDRMGSVGRKFLVAGKGGLNLTHSDPFETFVGHYGDRHGEVAAWLRAFDADGLREWARGLGVETFVGTSGRVFPRDLKAAPLLRAWVHRLRSSGVRFHVNHAWKGWDGTQSLLFETEAGVVSVEADAVVLALGGASWPVLGSDGAWMEALAQRLMAEIRFGDVVRISAGWVVGAPDPSQLLLEADEALAAAKRAGKDRAVSYP